MNNKGFTLVELIAVITILALLAVLVSTSVTKVVRDSKSDLYDTQIELIKSAAEAWGADNLNKLPEDGTCKYLTLETLKEYGLIESDIKNPKTNKPFSDELKIKISSNITAYGNSKLEYEVDSKNISSCENVYTSICKLISGESKEIGSKYECEVKPGTKHYFYILSKEEDKINLIMERNICKDGDVATAENKCLVAWYSAKQDHKYGPVTAMNHIHNATNDWINIPNIVMDYEDENIDYDTQVKGTNGYGSIKTINNITTITDKDGNVTATYENLKARLPKYVEVKVNGCTTKSGSCPLWLVDYMDSSSYYIEAQGKTNITGIYGYWTLSSYAANSSTACYVHYYGFVNHSSVGTGSNYGSRPVITVLESDVSE